MEQVNLMNYQFSLGVQSHFLQGNNILTFQKLYIRLQSRLQFQFLLLKKISQMQPALPRINMDERKVNDFIYGFIYFPKIAFRFVDTPYFQRLRNIKQLGCLHYVFPTANQTRFEHSLGTAYLAKEFINTLMKNHQDLYKKYNDEQKDEIILTVILAGLLHDINVKPYQHINHQLRIPSLQQIIKIMTDQVTSDIQIQLQQLKKRNQKKSKTQELQRQIKLIKSIMRKKKILNLIKGYADQQKISSNQNENRDDSNSQKYKKRIEEYSAEQVEIPFQQQENRPWQFQIIKNRDSGIDVCTFDFIERDSRYLGAQQMHIDHQLFRKQARILNTQSQGQNKKKRTEICFPSKYAEKIFRILHSRYILFKDYYNNVISIGIELMISDLMSLINENLALLYSGSKFKGIQDNFCRLNDNIFEDLQNVYNYVMEINPKLYKQEQNLKIAEAIRLMAYIKKRKLYKFVKELKYTINKQSEEFDKKYNLNKNLLIQDICSQAKKLKLNLQKNEICISIDYIGFGFSNENVFKKVRFFIKEGQIQQNMIPSSKNKNLSMLYSDASNERSIKIYLKQNNLQKIKIIHQCVQMICNQHKNIQFSQGLFGKTPHPQRQNIESVHQSSIINVANEINKK